MTELESRLKNDNYGFAGNIDIKPDKNIVPFLKMLLDNGLIDSDTSPKDSDLITRIKVQKFVYFAQQLFDLKFRYRHTMYLYGPYSTALANDYYCIQNINNASREGLKDWLKKEEFLKFAREHNDVKWLEIASTIFHTYKKNSITECDKLAERVYVLKRNFEKSYITEVCQELANIKFLER